jgi:hypothetical protein
MPATNFPEYAREIENVLNATIAASEAVRLDIRKSLIFRYDNAVHRPSLSQAEHKHTLSGVQVAPAPKLAQVVDEILT